MARIAYVAGTYVPLAQAKVHIEDRGYQFADAVYEVIAFQNGRLIDREAHLTRLERSLSELSIRMPMSRPALDVAVAEIIRRNGLEDGMLYMQISRGVARRDHVFPGAGIAPVLVMTVRRLKLPSAEIMARGVTVVTMPDLRWLRRDIKSTSLLANVLAKEAARNAGAYEAWLVDGQGRVTEGSSTNAWIVTRDGALVTHAIGPEILNGVTRRVVLALAREQGLALDERGFTPAEAREAREAFITSTTSWVLPVVAMDGHKIGDGRPGPIVARLHEAYASAVAGIVSGKAA